MVAEVVVEPQRACPSSQFVLASEHSNCAHEGQQTPPIREGEEPQQAKPLLTRATTVQERFLFRPDGIARAVIASTAATLVPLREMLSPQRSREPSNKQNLTIKPYIHG